MSVLRVFICIHLCASVVQSARAGDAPIRAVQPVAEYFVPFDANPRDHRPAGQLEWVTHLGTDFGPLGPGRDKLVWRDGRACADLRGGGSAGLWHSLAGLARDADATLDFTRCYPPWIAADRQPRCTGVSVRVNGHGPFALEIQAADRHVLWSWRETIDTAGADREYTVDCPPGQLRAAKFLNWVAGPDAEVAVDRLALRLEFPPMPFPDRVFLISYAKLSRCYDPRAGIVKNRAHWPTGRFEALPATGLFTLATAAAWTRGVVDRQFAEAALHAIHHTVSTLPRADGWLPHYVSHDAAGHYAVHPGTEFSTIDTSLYYHGTILASQILGDGPMLAQLEREVRALRFDHLRTPDGWVLHGFRQDGHTPLRGAWNGWGGEAALVLLTERMALGAGAPLKMAPGGVVHNGVGFIGEIQSLFYPQFDQARPAALAGADWRAARLALLAEQRAWFPAHEPDSAAAKVGVFGLSAGEALGGRGYVSNGTRKPTADVIHPHYILMAGRWEPGATYDLLRRMEAKGLLPPWGLVENIRPDLAEYLPMLGSLDAAFEAVGSYHLWARFTGGADAIDAAARACPLTADAIRAFYP
jgi:hypothetical protein